MKYLFCWKGEGHIPTKTDMKSEFVDGASIVDAGEKFHLKHKGELGIPIQAQFDHVGDTTMNICNHQGRIMVLAFRFWEPHKPIIEAKGPVIRKGGER